MKAVGTRREGRGNTTQRQWEHNAKAVGTQRKGSGNTTQRQCLWREGKCKHNAKAVALVRRRVETHKAKKAVSLARRRVETQRKGSVFGAKAVSWPWAAKAVPHLSLRSSKVSPAGVSSASLHGQKVVAAWSCRELWTVVQHDGPIHLGGGGGGDCF